MALAGAAALVFGLGVYLFVEVRSSPAATPPAPVVVAAPTTPDPPPSNSARSGRLEGLNRAIPRRDTPHHDPAPPPSVEPPPQGVSTIALPETGDTDVRLDTLMSEANKAYDGKDFEEAKTIANRVLAMRPGNVRMLRILVSVACIEGDTTEAQRRLVELPPSDRAAMRTRCSRDYGVVLSAEGPRAR
ncbi:MAG: hypothetical protein AB7P03_19110 [Kofleriaceae bacterium]